jgi:hypothetical protein
MLSANSIRVAPQDDRSAVGGNAPVNNKTLSYLPPTDSPTFGLLTIGGVVVLYFVYTRVSKRRAYSQIPSDGWGVSQAGERA